MNDSIGPTSNPNMAGLPGGDPNLGRLCLVERFRGLLKRTLLGNYLVPVLIGLSSLLWMGPLGSVLYGQDSWSFTNVFTFNSSPLIQYSYVYSWVSPITDPEPGFYLVSISNFFYQISHNFGWQDHLTVVFIIAVGCVGFWDLLTLVPNHKGPGRGWPGLFFRSAATLCYVVNPVTLSVVYWHVQGWTAFYSFLPFLMSYLVSLETRKRNDVRRFLQTLAVGIILGDGVSGVFAIASAYLVLIFLAILALSLVTKATPLRQLPGLVAMPIVLTVLLLGWSAIPYLLVPNYQLTYNGYVTPSNAVTSALQQNHGNTLTSVLMLTGFTWLHNVPGAFPFAYGTLLLSGVLASVVIFASLLTIRHSPNFILLYLAAIPAIIASAGTNPPFGSEVLSLIQHGGLFYSLVDPYSAFVYFYAILFPLGLYLLLRRGSQLMEVFGTSDEARYNTRGLAGPVESTRTIPMLVARFKSSPRSRLCLGAMVVAIAIAACLAAPLPIVSGGEYQLRGHNIAAFEIPSSFSLLSTYFAKNYSAPAYNVLILPMSSISAYTFGSNGSWLTGGNNFFASFIPYPAIYANTSPMAVALMNYLASPDLSGVLNVFVALHIRYVVINPYTDQSEWFMQRAPDGVTQNMSQITMALNKSVGTPVSVGGFSVYYVPEAQPIISVLSQVNLVQVPSWASYIALLNSINDRPTTAAAGILESEWSPNAFVGPAVVGIQPYSVITAASSYNLTGREFPYAILDNGSVVGGSPQALIEEAQGASYSSSTGVLELEDHLLASLNQSGGKLTDMNNSSANSYVNAIGHTGFLSYVSEFSPNLTVAVEANVIELESSNWLDIEFQSGNISATIELFQANTSPSYSLGIYLEYNGVRFAWTGATVPSQLTSTPISIISRITSTAVQAEILGPPVNISAQLNFSGTAQITADQGYNLSAAPPTTLDKLGNVTVQFRATNPSLVLTQFNVAQTGPINTLLVATSPILPPLVPSRVAIQYNGDWTVEYESQGASTARYLTLFFPSTMLWVGSEDGSPMEKLQMGSAWNTVALPDTGSEGSQRLATLSFNVGFNSGLFVSFVELAAVPAVALTLWRRRRT